MSNDNNTSGLGIGPMTTPGNGRLEGGTTRYEVDMALPGGKEAIVSLRIGAQAPDAEQQRHELLANVCPQSLTEGLERDLSKLQAQFEDYTGFDKQGARQMRVTGRERELLEMKIANRRNALQIARAQRALAERIQAEAVQARRASDQRIEAAATAKAQQIIEEAEIARRAKQIAARAGVGDK